MKGNKFKVGDLVTIRQDGLTWDAVVDIHPVGDKWYAADHNTDRIGYIVRPTDGTCLDHDRYDQTGMQLTQHILMKLRKAVDYLPEDLFEL